MCFNEVTHVQATIRDIDFDEYDVLLLRARVQVQQLDQPDLYMLSFNDADSNNITFWTDTSVTAMNFALTIQE